MKMQETAAWKLGDAGQKLVAKILMMAGWNVVPSYEYTGPNGNQAPRLEGAQGFVAVLPDLDIAHKGIRRWVEVKTKTDTVHWHNGHSYMHGFSFKHLCSYIEVEKQTSTPVWIFVYEKARNNILCAPLQALLAPGVSHIHKGPNQRDSQGDFNFKRDALKLFCIPDCGNEIFSMCDERWSVSFLRNQ